VQHGTDGAENPPWRHWLVFELVRSLMSTLTPGASASLVNTQAGCRLFIQLLGNDDDDDDDDVVRMAGQQGWDQDSRLLYHLIRERLPKASF